MAKTIAAEIKFKGVDGAEITEVKSYLLSEKCVITRNGENAAFADIQKGDIISAEVSGTRMHSMSLTEKSRDISAVFVKAQKNTNGVVYLTFSQSGKEKSYVLENVAKVTRNGQEIAWQNLRIGDLLTLKCEYERISDVVATSVKSQTSGKVTQIRMDKSGSYVTISSESSETEYKIIPNRVDVRSFFIGSGVTLFLDSKEVELALIADDALGFPRFKGYIVSKRYSSILMTNLNAKTPENTEVSVNENTVYTDSVTGKEITYEQLPDKALIYVVLDESLKTALYVTVL